jgi:hypothetical protein
VPLHRSHTIPSNAIQTVVFVGNGRQKNSFRAAWLRTLPCQAAASLLGVARNAESAGSHLDETGQFLARRHGHDGSADQRFRADDCWKQSVGDPDPQLQRQLRERHLDPLVQRGLHAALRFDAGLAKRKRLCSRRRVWHRQRDGRSLRSDHEHLDPTAGAALRQFCRLGIDAPAQRQCPYSAGVAVAKRLHDNLQYFD